jgi:uncharacterized protein (TIGR02996 family)
VTTEDDFQVALDLHLTDWQTRLVFADWLEEYGTPEQKSRAPGYRKMGHFRRYPHSLRVTDGYPWYFEIGHAVNVTDTDAAFDRVGNVLPPTWWRLIRTIAAQSLNYTKYFRSRREAENAAADAWYALVKEGIG